MKIRLCILAMLGLLLAVPAAAQKAPSRAELLQEIDQKMPRLTSLMEREGVDGILLTKVANFSWITAGLGDSHIVITSDAGAVNLLLMKDGRRYAIAGNSEMPRVMAEDLKGLGYEPKEFEWHQNSGDAIVAQLAAGRKLGSDAPREGFKNLDAAIVDIRTPLTATEIAKYRWLGRETALAVEEVARNLKPGMTERHIEALTSDALMRRGIRPTVLLIGVDDRIRSFRHAPPTDEAKLGKYGMVNVCARRWGLVAAVTRFVHFGPVPQEMQAKLQAAASVNASMQHATRSGVTAGQLLDQAKTFYAAQGYPEEWRLHHQGGAIGYAERDWVITPGGTQRVVDRQAFAYNPTVQGTKVEDTVLLIDGKIENLTRTGEWPELTTTVEGQTYTSPGILVIGK